VASNGHCEKLRINRSMASNAFAKYSALYALLNTQRGWPVARIFALGVYGATNTGSRDDPERAPEALFMVEGRKFLEAARVPTNKNNFPLHAFM
jgi:hypothetical protein